MRPKKVQGKGQEIKQFFCELSTLRLYKKSLDCNYESCGKFAPVLYKLQCVHRKTTKRIIFMFLAKCHYFLSEYFEIKLFSGNEKQTQVENI